MQRVGLIGCGGIVQRTHAVGYRALRGHVEIAALADVSDGNRTKAGEQFGVRETQRYADYRDLLAHAPIDTVVIATPHAFHAEQAIAAAAAGKAIITEKPMAVTLEDADRILAAVATHQVAYTVVHNLLFAPAVIEAQRLLAEGSLGPPLLGRGEILGNKNEQTTTGDRDWRASRQMGGGALIDSSYHEIYTVEALMGSPVQYVQARVATLKFAIDVDDTALMTFEHASGAASNVLASWCARSPALRGRWVSVSTTKGGIRIVYSDPVPLACWRDAPAGSGRWEDIASGDSPAATPIPDDVTGHAAYLRAAFAALESGEAMPVRGAQGRVRGAQTAVSRASTAS